MIFILNGKPLSNVIIKVQHIDTKDIYEYKTNSKGELNMGWRLGKNRNFQFLEYTPNDFNGEIEYLQFSKYGKTIYEFSPQKGEHTQTNQIYKLFFLHSTEVLQSWFFKSNKKQKIKHECG